MTAIPFKKRSFRKYFVKETNYFWFHQVIARILKAPTMAVAELLQSNLVIELNTIGERRTGTWFEGTWTSERGNYINASASAEYVGNNK